MVLPARHLQGNARPKWRQDGATVISIRDWEKHRFCVPPGRPGAGVMGGRWRGRKRQQRACRQHPNSCGVVSSCRGMRVQLPPHPVRAGWRSLQVVNIKYRALPKQFFQVKGGKKVRLPSGRVCQTGG